MSGTFISHCPVGIGDTSSNEPKREVVKTRILPPKFDRSSLHRRLEFADPPQVVFLRVVRRTLHPVIRDPRLPFQRGRFLLTQSVYNLKHSRHFSK